jgi:hypothetical protein
MAGVLDLLVALAPATAAGAQLWPTMGCRKKIAFAPNDTGMRLFRWIWKQTSNGQLHIGAVM